ncbi:hypothetical protein BaRGS_00016201 [Batillaria attramentaria]|uniref:Uncharacterized protein n=1 Tax=Batillaria attramentaria TaxID=370345 RepID=A0ABD0L089_9CAEN
MDGDGQSSTANRLDPQASPPPTLETGPQPADNSAQRVLSEVSGTQPDEGNACSASGIPHDAAEAGVSSLQRGNTQTGSPSDVDSESKNIVDNAAATGTRSSDATRTGTCTPTGTTTASTNEPNNPFFPGATATARLDQLYLMRPQLVPLLNLQHGGILGTEPWVIPTACPHQRMALNACLIPTHFVPSTCMTIPQASTTPTAMTTTEAGGVNAAAGFATSQHGTTLAHLAASAALGTNVSSSSPHGGVSLQRQESQVLQTTVGTNTPVSRKPSPRVSEKLPLVGQRV